MRELDDTDREILRLLLADARRPYADIADRVGLSATAVSDRVERLRELGVVRRFTVDLDRSTLREGVDVLVELDTAPDATEGLREALADASGVEHVFETAGGDLIVTATLPDERVREHLPVSDADAVTVRLLADETWQPSLGDATLGLDCAECGNTVTGEGVATTVGGDRYEFCCPSCRSRFEKRYADLESGG